MRVGIIGAGVIGQTLAIHLIRAGHTVALSNSRNPLSLEHVVSLLGPSAVALASDDAAVFGQVVFLTAPWRCLHSLPQSSRLAAKIVVDAMNPFDVQHRPIECVRLSSSQRVAARYRAARVVKGVNTMPWVALRSGPRPPGHRARLAVPLASDDPGALSAVGALLDDIGFDAVSVGSLATGDKLQGIGGPLFGVALPATTLLEIIEAAGSRPRVSLGTDVVRV